MMTGMASVYLTRPKYITFTSAHHCDPGRSVAGTVTANRRVVLAPGRTPKTPPPSPPPGAPGRSVAGTVTANRRVVLARGAALKPRVHGPSSGQVPNGETS